MFRKIKIHFIVILCTSLLAVSCSEDKGNYDFVDINEVIIDGLEEAYSITRFDDFNIQPDLSFTQDANTEDRYTYNWQAYKIEGLLVDDDKLTELSIEKNLTVKASLYPGAYKIYYTVTDTETELEWQYDFKVEIVNSIYEGWLLLNDNSAAPRLDMISLIDEEYKPIYDILHVAESGLVLSGTPGFVSTSYYGPSRTYGIYVSTSGNGTTKIESNTFKWDKSLNLSQEFGSTQPELLEAQSITEKSWGTALTVVDNDFYYYFAMWQVAYSIPKNIVDGEKVSVSPMVGRGYAFGNTIFYDTTYKRFIYFNGNGCYAIPEQNNTVFDYTTGKDLMYMAGIDYNGTSGTATFAVLKDPVDGKSYAAIFDAWTLAQSHYSEITATDFDQAKNITFSPEFGYMFYSVGSKVYQYDLFVGETFEMLDKGSEISLLKFHDFASGKYSQEENGNLAAKLIVCSFDGSNGTFELYTVPPVNGPITLFDSYDGFGKIISATYRER